MLSGLLFYFPEREVPSISRLLGDKSKSILSIIDKYFLKLTLYIKLNVPSRLFAQASTGPSPRRNQETVPENTQRATLGAKTVLFGDYEGIAYSFVNCAAQVRRSRHKAVFEVKWDGMPAIAQCYSELRYVKLDIPVIPTLYIDLLLICITGVFTRQ